MLFLRFLGHKSAIQPTDPDTHIAVTIPNYKSYQFQSPLTSIIMSVTPRIYGGSVIHSPEQSSDLALGSSEFTICRYQLSSGALHPADLRPS